MADLAARLAAEGDREVLVEQRDRARANLAAVMRNRHHDSSVAGRLRHLLRHDTRKLIPIDELRQILGDDVPGPDTPTVTSGGQGR